MRWSPRARMEQRRTIGIDLIVVVFACAVTAFVILVPASRIALWEAVRDRLSRAASAENVVAMDPDIAALRADMGEDIGYP